MILSIAAVTDEAKLAELRDGLSKLSWQDGRKTAGSTAQKVKRNEQAVMGDAAGKAMREQLISIVTENPIVKAAARPRRISTPMISRTADGGYYGPHVDNAMMGKGNARIRTDLSFTLFLSDPDAYEGGELVVHAAGIVQNLKGKAGELVLYPTNSIHEVTPVTSGSRIVCVGWIESLIRDPGQRELLFDMENLRISLRQKMGTESPELLTIDKSIANLLRMWGQA